ncbi:MAG: 2Fe-2S iron-sulfur cluster-binding protein [Flavobacteriales bacterium]|nr:2Fe-2S iron-sulfur cluster-binding protein [Flavobacteriales bacterium]
MDHIINITVIDREGTPHQLEAPTDIGMNVMELCRSYELPVEGTCGGMAMCASCHVYVLSDHNLQEKSPDEEAMLDQAFFVKPNSRLGCQIKLNDALEGLKIKLAETGE